MPQPDASYPLLNAELYLVLGASNLCYETDQLGFAEVIEHIRAGQFADVHKVLRVRLVDGHGAADDVTMTVARAIVEQSTDHPLAYGSTPYVFIERVLSCRDAERCRYHVGAHA